MKHLTTIVFALSCSSLFAQPNTEVYLVDIVRSEQGIKLDNPINISNNEGYDNQPSFYDEKTILFSSTRNGQTDIANYDIASGHITWMTNTLEGSEYSPLKIPNKNEVSAIRLDTDGLQRLYRYSSDAKPKELLKNLKVGYHLWYNEDILVSSVLVEDRMDLIVSNLKDNTNYTFQKNVGRSLLKIPNSELISFISKENGLHTLKSLHPITGATKEITPLFPEINDICWLPDGTVLIPINKTIYGFKPGTNSKMATLHQFQEKEINGITRMAVDTDGKHLALVSEERTAMVVQKQVEAFNSRDLDAFASCYSENVLVQNFPNDTLYVGNNTLKQNFERFYANTPNTKVEVVKRIVVGNKVIDEERATVSGKTHRQVAIYEVNNGSIDSMSFIFEKEPHPEAEAIIEKQLDAYRARDIDAFLENYSEDIEVYNFPHQSRSKGQEEMRKGYASFFENTPDLNCEINNRIIIGNKVIDEEYLTINGNNFSAVAIYEVGNGKISRVTFVQ